MKKVIFIDVDGTLTNDVGVVPESTKLAIRKARENGHLVFLSTGRSKAELFPEVLDVGFDGIIGAAGGYIEFGEKILFHERIKKEHIQAIVDFFNKNGIDFKLESNEGIFASGSFKKRIRAFIDHFILETPEAKKDIEKGLQPMHDILIESDDLIREDINKIFFLGSEIPIETIKKEFESTFTVIPSTVSLFGKNSGELSILGINKATAIAKILEHLTIGKEDTFAYGDGLNDLEMLEFVQHGIAMGNANELVKEVADDVTNSNVEDGIYNSFKKYGLI